MIKQFKRKNNRLAPELYSGGYWYFIPICTAHKQCIFVAEGLSLQDNRFVLNSLGVVVESHIGEIPEMYQGVGVESYGIMPNHVHLIVSIQKGCGVGLSDVIRTLKAHVQVQIRHMIKNREVGGEVWRDKPSSTGVGFSLHKIWQKSFYDHIIRNDEDLIRIQEYIENNPKKWELDSLYGKMKGVV